MNGLTRVQFEGKKLLVSLLNVLNVFLVLNLELMEINKLQVVTHLFFVSDLGLGFQDLLLKGHVLQLEFVNECLFGLELIIHILQ